MSGNNYLLDTNIVLYLLGGDKVLAGILGAKSPYVSYITEMELLGSPILNGYRGKGDKELFICLPDRRNESGY